MPATYLRINITAHRPGSLPGYDGDRRVEWSIAEDAVSLAEAQRRTRDALRVLRAFWEDAAPDGLRFLEFAKTVLADGNGQASAPAPAKALAGGAASAAAGAASPSLSPSPTASLPASPPLIDLVDPLAEKLVRHPNVLPAFLSDLRDWDSFRLLLRRHGGDVPFVTAASFEAAAAAAAAATDTPAAATAAPSTPTASATTTASKAKDLSLSPPSPTCASAANGSPLNNSSLLLTSSASSSSSPASVLLSAFTSREHLWQEERASLHAALWAAGEQVRTLVATLTDTLEKVATLTANSDNANSNASSPRSRKSVRWDELVLKREVIRETASHWGMDAADSNILEWREAEWLKELARQEELARAARAVVNNNNGKSSDATAAAAANEDNNTNSPGGTVSGNSFSFSPEDILAVVRATRRLAGRVSETGAIRTSGKSHAKDTYVSGSEDDDDDEDDEDEDDDTEEDTDDDDNRNVERSESASGASESLSPMSLDDHHDDDTESEEDADANVMAARLERLRELADLAVANSSKSIISASPVSRTGAISTVSATATAATVAAAAGGGGAASTKAFSPGALHITSPTQIVAPASAPLSPITEGDGETLLVATAAVRSGRAALDEDRPNGAIGVGAETSMAPDSAAAPADAGGADRNVVLIASGRRRRARPRQDELAVETTKTAQPSSSTTAVVSTPPVAQVPTPIEEQQTPFSLAAEPSLPPPLKQTDEPLVKTLATAADATSTVATASPATAEAGTGSGSSSSSSNNNKGAVVSAPAVEPRPPSTPPSLRADGENQQQQPRVASTKPHIAPAAAAHHATTNMGVSSPAPAPTSLPSNSNTKAQPALSDGDNNAPSVVTVDLKTGSRTDPNTTTNTTTFPTLTKKRSSGRLVQRVWKKVSSEFRKSK
ncbi:hypothetical protein HDU87_004584 [Geranomyces variabilis]|uniref:Uncharacterized protein n=1 Tax=Geranomyces variabilis TaxID=109894 RepID=A0AAD5XPW2_9FUNG|nr:hypothetical protein HDU87_004584 [Geranomyces variabilis]